MATITDIIRERALANGADPDVLLRFAQVESGLDPNARAKSSSAGGLFQFVDKTWGQYGGEGDRFDPYTAADAGARLLRDNAAVLQSAGIDPTTPNAYLAHFAGAGTAAKLLKADDATPVANILSPQAVQANPFLSKMTVGDLRTWATNKMTPGQVQSGTPSPAAGSGGTGGAQPDRAMTGMLPMLTMSAAGDAEQSNGLASVAGMLTGPAQDPPPIAAPPPMQVPPPRRIDLNRLRTALQTPLMQRGSSFPR